MPPPRNRVPWRALWLSLIIIVVIIAGSMVLVRFRNLDRAASDAVLWALDDLARVSSDVFNPVFAPQRYGLALAGFRTAIENDQLPVDSVREFYQAYTRHARDGVIDAADLRELGPYFGLTPAPPEIEVESATPEDDTTDVDTSR